MKISHLFALVGWVALTTSCGDAATDTNVSNNATNNSTNTASNNASNNSNNGTATDGSAAAQELGVKLFNAVYLAVYTNAVNNSQEFSDSGKEGLVDCLKTTSYGQSTIDFEENSGPSIFAVDMLMDGCFATQSGTYSPFEVETRDLSGDGLPETFLFNGTLAAVTFDEDGFSPAAADYDPNATPTCVDVVLENILIEGLGLVQDESGFSNDTQPHNAGGYTEGQLRATCGEQKLLCNLDGGSRPPVAINLESVASAKYLRSICVFE